MKILWEELLENDSETWSGLSRWEFLGFYHHSLAQWFAVELSQADCKSKDTPKYLQKLLFHRLAGSWFTGDIKFDEPLQAWTLKNKDYIKLDENDQTSEVSKTSEVFKSDRLALWWEIAGLGNDRRNRELKNDFRELLKNETENAQTSEVSETSEVFKYETFIRLALCTREKILQEIYPSETPTERLEHRCTAFDNLIRLTETETKSDNFQNMLLLTKDDLERLRRNAAYDLERAKLMEVANTGCIRFDPDRLMDRKGSSGDRYKQISDAFRQCLDEDFQTIRHSDLNPLLDSGFPIISNALQDEYKTLCHKLREYCSIKELKLPNFQPITSNRIKISLEPSSTGQEVVLDSMDISLSDDWRNLHEAWWKIFDPTDPDEDDLEEQSPGSELRERCQKLIDDFLAEKDEDNIRDILDKTKEGIKTWLRRTQLDFEKFGSEIPLSTLVRLYWGEILYDTDEPEGLSDQTDEMLSVSPQVFVSLKYIFKDIFSNIKKHGQGNVEACLRMGHSEAVFNWTNDLKISDNKELNTLKNMCEMSKSYESRLKPGDPLPKHIEERAEAEKGSGFYKFYRYRKNLAIKGCIVNQVWKLDNSDGTARFQGWLTIKP